VLYLVAPPLPELAGGRWSAPDWLIVGLAGLTAVFAVVYLVLRHRSSGRDPR